MPQELMPDILVYVDPDWAGALSKTSKHLRRVLHKFYKENAHHLVRNEWHQRLCKRARDSISTTISPTPRALASLVHRRCARCHQRFLGRIHFFGMAIHDICLKDLLINIYYLRRDFALGVDAINTLPQYKRQGSYIGVYVCVWKNGFRGIVPYEWTAHCLVQTKAASSKKWTRNRYPYLD